jgi:hypothetical protein
MPIQNAQISSATITQFSGGDKSQSSYGIVYSVILDETHPRIKNGKEDINLIGAIEFRYSNKAVSNDKDLPLAYPFDKNYKNLPVRNETVEIIAGNSGQTLYKRIGLELSPNLNVEPNFISSTFKPDADNPGSKKDNYNKVENTGISRTNSDDSTKYDGYGDYFKKEIGIHKLKLYEGDMLFESRFGQSIRFSGYNNVDHKFSPTIIIRNAENITSKQKDLKSATLEDITKDGSIIALTSDQYQLEFVPGTIDDKGKTDFQTKPQSFDNYPSKFIGDQILLNSGRIILSAKSAEMLFFSKKNYGFISDGAMSIDNKLGIDVTVGDDINIMTNDRDVNIISGKGSIFLGSDSLEPMVKGQKLVDLLAELIDVITQQIYLTPSGPSATGPTNVAQFGSIKSKLNTILSKLNQTS